jgi:hypothetical protein
MMWRALSIWPYILVPAPVVKITLTPKAATATAGAITLAGTVSSIGTDGTIDITVPGNGVVVTIAGEHTLAVSLPGVGGGAIAVGSSPSAFTVVAAGANPASCSATGKATYHPFASSSSLLQTLERFV